MNYFCNVTEFGPTIKEWIKNFTKFRINELSSEVMHNHPSNTSYRLGNNNLKLSEMIALAEYMKVPFVIKFGPIEAKNKFEVEENKEGGLKRKTKLQRELIQAQSTILELQKELIKKNKGK